MARRRDRRIARDRTPDPVAVINLPRKLRIDPPKPSPPSSMRGTFRVAQAHRVLADSLPGVVRNRSGERLAASRAGALSLSDGAALDQGAAQRSPSRVRVRKPVPRPVTAQLGIASDKRDPAAREATLKCRPDPNDKSSGGGSRRSFVPWKKGDC